jgi:hypothetical protein
VLRLRTGDDCVGATKIASRFRRGSTSSRISSGSWFAAGAGMGAAAAAEVPASRRALRRASGKRRVGRWSSSPAENAGRTSQRTSASTTVLLHSRHLRPTAGSMSSSLKRRRADRAVRRALRGALRAAIRWCSRDGAQPLRRRPKGRVRWRPMPEPKKKNRFHYRPRSQDANVSARELPK